jgi:SAM-dependent methyltransferase
VTRADSWDAYLADFHAQRPGITEDLLAPAQLPDGTDPYAWLLEGVPDAGRILDLACGSAPLRAALGDRWVGIDRSAAELARAASLDSSAILRGDATALPFADGSFAAVVCSMALMLIRPIEAATAELIRVLRPGGTLHVLLPTTAPLHWKDRARFARLYATIRAMAQLPPTAMRRRPGATLARFGFEVVDDRRARFAYPIRNGADADRLVDALYLPGVAPDRIEAGKHRARGWVGSEIGLPLHRIIATPAPT